MPALILDFRTLCSSEVVCWTVGIACVLLILLADAVLLGELSRRR